jgi:hypothetical protein
MASSDATPIPKKNVAYRVTFPILDADGDLVTGASALDSEVSKDGGTFADCTNEATEIASGSGVYFLDLTSTEMNADTVAVIVKTSTSGAKTTVLVMYPEEAGDLFSSGVRIKKNTALSNFSFVMVDSSDHLTPKTGLTVTAQRSIDGAAFGSCTNSPTELSNGVYLINLSAGDLNGNVITFRFSSTGADTRLLTLITQVE